MGVGISAFVLSLMVVIMIIPTIDGYPSDSGYTPKQDIELERLLLNYTSRLPEDGGPYDEVLIDFQQIRLNEIKSLEEGLVELDKVINIKKAEAQVQREVIEHEQKLIVSAAERMKKDWDAQPHDTRHLETAFKKLETVDTVLGQLVEQKRITMIDIDTKTILYEIQKHDAKLIGIELSANCIAMAKLNSEVSQYENDLSDEQWDAELEKIKQTSSCPTYEDLYSLDTSITSISGKFSYHDGFFHREKTGYQDSFRAYDNDDKIRILVDPPQNEGIRIKMITIEPNLGLYTDKGFTTKITDGKRVMGNERIIKNCYTATITADNWKMLLPDTIFTFRNGCESAEIEDTLEFDMPKTEIDIWSSPNVQYAEWLLKIKQTCKVKC